MLWWFLSERGGERGGGLIDPFVNPKHDVELETAMGGARLICKAFFGVEPCVDFLLWIFIGRVLSKGKLLRIVPVEGPMPTAWSYLDCMRRSGAPCSSIEHLWVRRP